MISTAYDGWLGARHSKITPFRLLLCSVPEILAYVNKPKALVTSEGYENKHSVTLASRAGESSVIYVWIVQFDGGVKGFDQ